MKYSLLFEVLEALHWRRLDEATFEALSFEEQALVIAHYRTHHQIEAVLSWDMERKHRRANRAK